MRIFSFFTFLLVSTTGLFAASFDCSKASTRNEKAICSNAKLSKLDEVLAQKYRKARSAASDAKKLKTEQVHWIKSLGTCNGNAGCLIEGYETRLRILSYALGETPSARVSILERQKQLDARERQLLQRENDFEKKVNNSVNTINSNQTGGKSVKEPQTKIINEPVKNEHNEKYTLTGFILRADQVPGFRADRGDLQWCAESEYFSGWGYGLKFYILNDFMFVSDNSDVYPIAKSKNGKWEAPNCTIHLDGAYLRHRSKYNVAEKYMWNLHDLPMANEYPSPVKDTPRSNLYEKLEKKFRKNTATALENRKKREAQRAAYAEKQRKFKDKCLDWVGATLTDEIKQSFSEVYATPWREIELLRVEYVSYEECNFILDTKHGIRTWNAVEGIKNSIER